MQRGFPNSVRESTRTAAKRWKYAQAFSWLVAGGCRKLLSFAVVPPLRSRGALTQRTMSTKWCPHPSHGVERTRLITASVRARRDPEN